MGVKAPSKDCFVIQKHAAGICISIFALELDGVMKSGRFPRVPSDPCGQASCYGSRGSSDRIHKFEGTIPQVEYGGGTVCWDRGTTAMAGAILIPWRDYDAATRKAISSSCSTGSG